MLKLDPNRPKSNIFGEHGGAVHGQDGKYFDAAGNHLPELDPKPSDPVPARVRTRTDPEDKPDLPAPAPKLFAENPNDLIDLKAWRRGEFKAPWHIVSNAVQVQYSERPRNMEHAYQIIDAE